MKIIIFSVLIVFVISFTSYADSDFNVSAELMKSSSVYESFLGENNITIGEWTALFKGDFSPTDDIVIHLLHSSSKGNTITIGTSDQENLQDATFDRQYTQAAAAYNLLKDDELTIHAGLGYKFTGNHYKHPLTNDETTRLAGQGFIGQVNVRIALLEELVIDAMVSGSPWYTWSHSKDNTTTTNATPGSSYNYQLALEYTFKDEWGIRAGYNGGSFHVPEFNSINVDETKASFSGVSGGVIYSF